MSGHRGLRALCLRDECYASELLGLPSLKGVKKLGDSALRGPDEAAGVFAGDLLKIAVDALPALPDSPEPFVIGARGAAMRELLVETSPATRLLVERSRVTDGQLGCVEVVLKAMRDPDALTAAVGAVVDTALASPDGAKLVARDKAARANDLPTGAMAALVERVWAELAPRVAAGGNLAPFLRVGLFNKAYVWTMIKQRVDATGVGIKDDVAAHVRCIRAAAEFATPEVAALFFVGTEFLDALDAVQDVWFSADGIDGVCVCGGGWGECEGVSFSVIFPFLFFPPFSSSGTMACVVGGEGVCFSFVFPPLPSLPFLGTNPQPFPPQSPPSPFFLPHSSSTAPSTTCGVCARARCVCGRVRKRRRLSLLFSFHPPTPQNENEPCLRDVGTPTRRCLLFSGWPCVTKRSRLILRKKGGLTARCLSGARGSKNF